MQAEGIAARLAASIPNVWPHLAAAMKPALRLGTWPIDDAHLALGASKFGGKPDLARGADWPAWNDRSGHRRPMKFFTQVDLAAATKAAPGPLDLPAAGLLSFFADFDRDGEISGLYSWEQQGARVIYTPAGTDLQRFDSPVPPLTSAALAMVPMWSWPQDPPAGVDLTDGEFDALESLDREYEVELRGIAGQWHLDGRHQLGGHARYIQHPVEEEVVQAVNGVFDAGSFDHASYEATKDQAKDWRLILQLDSDSGLDVMWGDAGTIYWEARHADASAGVWNRTAFNFQCS